MPAVELSKDAGYVGVEKNLQCAGCSGQMDSTCEGCSRIICRECSPFGFCPTTCEIRPEKDGCRGVDKFSSLGKDILYNKPDDTNELDKITTKIKREVFESLLNAATDQTDEEELLSTFEHFHKRDLQPGNKVTKTHENYAYQLKSTFFPWLKKRY